jgi:hypothetical protein
VNLPLVLYFNEKLDPDSVSPESIDIRSIEIPAAQDPDNLVQQPGGIQAAVEFRVSGASLYIIPTLSFNNGDPVFGFMPKAAYEIKFSQPPASKVVKSASGKNLVVPLGQPIAFITTDTVLDQFAGTPEPSFYYYEPPYEGIDINSVPATEWKKLTQEKEPVISLKPLTYFRIFFSEPVLKVWAEDVFLVNSSDHTSEAVFVKYFESPYEHVPIPGLWFLIQTTNLKPELEGISWSKQWLWNNPTGDPTKVGVSYVQFMPNEFLEALPPDKEIHVQAKGVISDLAGNTKGDGSSGVMDERIVHSHEDAIELDPIEEHFENKNYEDNKASSAIWGGTAGDFLRWGGGGGNGEDGTFYPPDQLPPINDPNDLDNFDPTKPAVVLDEPGKTVWLSTVTYEDLGTHKKFHHYEYNFTTFNVPFGWTVKPIEFEYDESVDEAPEDGRWDMAIFVTGQVKLDGVLDASGNSGESRKANWSEDPDEPGTLIPNPNGTIGGKSYAGGAQGGDGGSIPSGGETGTFVLNKDEQTLTTIFALPEAGSNQDGFVGVTGISTGLGDYWLEDSMVDHQR